MYSDEERVPPAMQKTSDLRTVWKFDDGFSITIYLHYNLMIEHPNQIPITDRELNKIPLFRNVRQING